MKHIVQSMLVTVLVLSASVQLSCAKSGTMTQAQLNRYKPLKANEGRALMSLEKAKLRDVHLAKPVKYFDIKSYEINYDELNYEGGWSFDMDAYKKLSSSERKKIRSAKPISSGSPFGATYFADSPMRSIYFTLLKKTIGPAGEKNVP